MKEGFANYVKTRVKLVSMNISFFYPYGDRGGKEGLEH
jgi:hypothetical protein